MQQGITANDWHLPAGRVHGCRSLFFSLPVGGIGPCLHDSYAVRNEDLCPDDGSEWHKFLQAENDESAAQDEKPTRFFCLVPSLPRCFRQFLMVGFVPARFGYSNRVSSIGTTEPQSTMAGRPMIHARGLRLAEASSYRGWLESIHVLPCCAAKDLSR